MANTCPRCGGTVKRTSGNSSTAWRVGGLVGMLIVSAFGSYHCERCGKIPRNEFNPDVKNKMMMNSVLLVMAAIALIILVFYVVAYI